MSAGYTVVSIPCCLCGTMILPNGANQCSACLAQQFNLKALLQKNGEPLKIHQCRQCRKFERTERYFEHCAPESPQLLSICLKHIPVLVNPKSGSAHHLSSSKLHVVDAIWVWTEPHSMRLKVRVTIRTEVENVQIQQRVLVEFIVSWKQCPDCNREYTSRTWQALVQLRQKRDDGAPRKGLATLEMALARNQQIRKHVLKIDASRHGLDFYFLSFSQAQQFGQFLSRLAPMRMKTTQKLVSADVKSNSANLKQTIAADMVPLCRDDLILVAKEARGILSGRLGLVLKVASSIKIIDASPNRTTRMDLMELSADAYYKNGADKTFPILQTTERMIRFVVLDVELIDPNDSNDILYTGPSSSINKYAMANVLVARESDMGQNDLTYNCVTHLGHLIQSGDHVLGYDLESTASTLTASSASLGVVDLDQVLRSNVVLPDVVLVKKVSGGASHNQNKDDDDATQNEEHGSGPVLDDNNKRISKKKLRRRQKRDKKKRELEESAQRMGFIEGNDNINEQDDDDNFEHQLANDPELAADLHAMEEQLATFPEITAAEPAEEDKDAAVVEKADDDKAEQAVKENGVVEEEEQQQQQQEA